MELSSASFQHRWTEALTSCDRRVGKAWTRVSLTADSTGIFTTEVESLMAHVMALRQRGGVADMAPESYDCGASSHAPTVTVSLIAYAALSVGHCQRMPATRDEAAGSPLQHPTGDPACNLARNLRPDHMRECMPVDYYLRVGRDKPIEPDETTDDSLQCSSAFQLYVHVFS